MLFMRLHGYVLDTRQRNCKSLQCLVPNRRRKLGLIRPSYCFCCSARRWAVRWPRWVSLLSMDCSRGAASQGAVGPDVDWVRTEGPNDLRLIGENVVKTEQLTLVALHPMPPFVR